MNNKNFPFYLCIISIFTCITAPTLFTDGMFMDGLFYATIARNLSVGIGSFWDLRFTETIFPHFHEHPPLAIGLQSIFFDIFGDSIYVERFYSMFTFFITGGLIVIIWRRVVNSEFKKIAWLPLVFWLSIPLNTWAVSNNMLENTMMIFTSLSILFMLLSLEKSRFVFVLLAGLCIFLGFLTKGFTALFPYSLYFWAFVFRKITFGRFVTDSVLLLLFTLLPAVLVFLLSNNALQSITAYLNIQVVNSLRNIETVDNRFWILFRLVKELIPAMVILVILVLISKAKPKKFIGNQAGKQNPYFFLLLGLSGVIPVMLSMKQSGFYILATFPCFAIFFAMLISKPINKWYSNISTGAKSYRLFKIASIFLLLLSVGLSISQAGKIGRDKEKIQAAYAVKKSIPKKSIISIDPELKENWSLHGYFYRYSYISLDADSSQQHKYLLTPQKSSISKRDYQKTSLPTEHFELWVKRNSMKYPKKNIQ